MGTVPGDAIAGNPLSPPPGLPSAATAIITSVSPAGPGPYTSVTLLGNTTVAEATAQNIGIAPAAGINITFPAFASPVNAFTTNGVVGGKANIGVTGSTGVTVSVAGQSPLFAPCAMSGYDSTNAPVGTPIYPPGSTTPAVSAVPPVFAAGAYVNLTGATGPTPNNQTVTLGEGGTGSVTLSAAQGTYPIDPNGFQLVGGPSQVIPLVGGGNLTVTQVGTTSTVNLSNTAGVATSGSFTFNACDTLALVHGGPLCSGVAGGAAAGQITVIIGTPPVIQPFSEQVTGGQLVLSCNAPVAYVTPAGPNQSPAPTGGANGTGLNPLLQCPEFQFRPSRWTVWSRRSPARRVRVREPPTRVVRLLGRSTSRTTGVHPPTAGL